LKINSQNFIYSTVYSATIKLPSQFTEQILPTILILKKAFKNSLLFSSAFTPFC